MNQRVRERVREWSSRPFAGGYAGLRDLADEGFSGVVETTGGPWLCLLNGTVVGLFDGRMDALGDAEGTAYDAPDPALPLLFAMWEAGATLEEQYYTNDTPIAEADDTLSSGGFSGYIELSDNVLSGDYYLCYYGDRSMSVAFVGSNERLVTGEEAFERADDEVGIYDVYSVDLDVTEVPEPDPEPERGSDPGPGAAGAAGVAGSDDRDGSGERPADPGTGRGRERERDRDPAETRGDGPLSTGGGDRDGGAGGSGDSREAGRGRDDPRPGERPDGERGGDRRTGGETDPRGDPADADRERSGSAGDRSRERSDRDPRDPPADDGAARGRDRGDPSADRSRDRSGRDGGTADRPSGGDRPADDAGARDRSTTDRPAGNGTDDGPSTAGPGDERGSADGRSGTGDGRPAGGGDGADGRGSPTGTPDGTGEGRTSRGPGPDGREGGDGGRSLGDRSRGRDRDPGSGSGEPPSRRSDPPREERSDDGRADREAGTQGTRRTDADDGRGRTARDREGATAPDRDGDVRRPGAGTDRRTGRGEAAGGDAREGVEPGDAGADRGGTDPEGDGLRERVRRQAATIERLEERVAALEADRDDSAAATDRLRDRVEDVAGDLSDLRRTVVRLDRTVEGLETGRDRAPDRGSTASPGADARDGPSATAGRDRSGGVAADPDSAAAETGSTDLSVGEALAGTTLLVRYGSRGDPTLETAHAGEADRAAVEDNLRIEAKTGFDAGSATVEGRPFGEFLNDRLEYRCFEWLVRELIYEIRDTGNADALGGLYDAIPRFDRAEFGGEVVPDADGEDDPDPVGFDLVVRDDRERPLVAMNFHESRDPATADLVDGLQADAEVAAAAAGLDAAFLVTTCYFEGAARESAEAATGGTLLSRGSRKGYVSVSRKRGFHLCLVDVSDGDFHLKVPEL
jgi:hypothetical protein